MDVSEIYSASGERQAAAAHALLGTGEWSNPRINQPVFFSFLFLFFLVYGESRVRKGTAFKKEEKSLFFFLSQGQAIIIIY